MMSYQIVQAGMGIAVSDWLLANTVGQLGQLGVVSGTALDTVLIRRLQLGDPTEHIRKALAEFPYPAMAERILKKYFIPSGKAAQTAFARSPMLSLKMTTEQLELLTVANFVEVYLAKLGHMQKIGINFLEKIQTPILPSLYGAMLAGVDVVLMGAGIPKEVPFVLDRLAQGEDADYRFHVAGATEGDDFRLQFSPSSFVGKTAPKLKRPDFLAIISSNTLGTMLAKKIAHPVDGFVVEAPTAGGHNAPPRGKMTLNPRGEPIYGERDRVNFAELAKLGLPFWLAGSSGSPEGLHAALKAGANGIQVGTAFALCRESGLDPALRHKLLAQGLQGRADVYTDPVASPTGFPFKVANLKGSNSEPETYQQRNRVCDLGYLREAYKKVDGLVGYRCASEPVAQFMAKGGDAADSEGRKCLCNALMANIKMGQLQKDGEVEKPILTIGDDVNQVQRFVKPGQQDFSAADVIEIILKDQPAPTRQSEIKPGLFQCETNLLNKQNNRA